MSTCQTLSQGVRPEVPHHPWRVITEQGLKDDWPNKHEDKWMTVRHGYMRMQAQENTEVQQRGVPTTSQRTEELKQYMEAALRGPTRIVICKNI